MTGVWRHMDRQVICYGRFVNGFWTPLEAENFVAFST